MGYNASPSLKVRYHFPLTRFYGKTVFFLNFQTSMFYMSFLGKYYF